MKRLEIEQYIGNQSQIGGTRHYELTDGWGRNLRAIDVDSGSGLRYTVLPDRGMDISLASFRGINLVYITCNGETHPSFYEPEGSGWLHTFAGGLLVTCGLTYLGAPVNDEGEELGLHGRYSTIPACRVADLSHWTGDDYQILLKGSSTEGSLFGHKMRLDREIATRAGTNNLVITDKVTNTGFKPAPFTILYHMNLGYPLLSEHAELIIDTEESIPRDPIAERGINEFRQFIEPQPGFEEQVYFHVLRSDANGKAGVTLRNKKIGISLTIRFDKSALPWFTQWKMMGQGDYVLGLEPGNVPVKNRKVLKEEGLLPWLQPGESRTSKVEVFVEESH